MAALNFPNSPSVGQKYPVPAVPGVPVYTWDGEKWSTAGSVYATSAPPGDANPIMDGTASAGASTKYSREDHIHPSDTAKLDKAGGTMTGALVLAADPAAPLEPATKQYADGKMKLDAQQTITNGFRFTTANVGTLTSPFTPNAYTGNYQVGFNAGAFTFNPPANDCAIDFMMVNVAGAGAVTFAAGWTVGTNKGDLLTTTNGHIFIISIRRMNNISTYTIKALQ